MLWNKGATLTIFINLASCQMVIMPTPTCGRPTHMVPSAQHVDEDTTKILIQRQLATTALPSHITDSSVLQTKMEKACWVNIFKSMPLNVIVSAANEAVAKLSGRPRNGKFSFVHSGTWVQLTALVGAKSSIVPSEVITHVVCSSSRSEDTSWTVQMPKRAHTDSHSTMSVVRYLSAMAMVPARQGGVRFTCSLRTIQLDSVLSASTASNILASNGRCAAVVGRLDLNSNVLLTPASLPATCPGVTCAKSIPWRPALIQFRPR